MKTLLQSKPLLLITSDMRNKPSIAQTIAERTFADVSLGASFFCSRDFDDRSNLRFIFPTLAVQLARRYAQFPSAFIRLFQADPEIVHESLYNKMKKLIVRPRFAGIPKRGPTGRVAPWSEGLPPSECATLCAGMPIPMNWVLFQDGVDLIHFVFVQCDVHGCEILQDPRFFRRAGDSDDVRTCMLWNKSSGERIPSTPLARVHPESGVSQND